MRTRSTAPSLKKTESTQSQPTPKTLTPAERPSKTFILPTSASDDSRFVSLPNPQTGALNRYFFCPEKGVYEFTVVAPSLQQPRSFLFTSKSINVPKNEEGSTPATSVGKGSVSKVAEFLVATPIDFMFFMVPLLSPESTQAKKLFQPLDDIIDSRDELPKHFQYVLYNYNFRKTLKARAEAICDTVEAGDEKMFRFSETKFLKELISKAERMVAQGLPASLEERFIRQALVTPMMAIKRENPTGATSSNKKVEGESQPEKQESQLTTPGATSSDSATPSGTGETGESTPATEPTPTPDEATNPDNVTRLLRISTALAFMKESYIPPSLCARLDEILASPESPLDFKPLQERLEHISKLRAEALASRSLGDFSRKRGAEDEDAAEARAEKRRKEEEEKKKKSATLSRGVKDLQKVNTSGMKKMSDFFGKAAAQKKS